MRTETQPLPRLDREVESDWVFPEAPVLAPRAPRRLNSAGVFIVAAATIAAVGLLYLIQTSDVAGLGYEISRLEAERQAALLANQELTYQVAAWEALPRVEQTARVELGMRPLEERVFITVPRPAADELVVPEPAPTPRRSLGERIWDRLTGEAEARHPGETAP